MSLSNARRMVSRRNSSSSPTISRALGPQPNPRMGSSTPEVPSSRRSTTFSYAYRNSKNDRGVHPCNETADLDVPPQHSPVDWCRRLSPPCQTSVTTLAIAEVDHCRTNVHRPDLQKLCCTSRSPTSVSQTQDGRPRERGFAHIVHSARVLSRSRGAICQS